MPACVPHITSTSANALVICGKTPRRKDYKYFYIQYAGTLCSRRAGGPYILLFVCILTNENACVYKRRVWCTTRPQQPKPPDRRTDRHAQRTKHNFSNKLNSVARLRLGKRQRLCALDVIVYNRKTVPLVMARGDFIFVCTNDAHMCVEM